MLKNGWNADNVMLNINSPDDLVINDAAHDHVLTAIKTVPIKPHFSSIVMLAEGIAPPKYGDEQDRARFIGQCRISGVSASSVELESSSPYVGKEPELGIKNARELFKGEHAIEDLFCGKRAHQLELSIKWGFPRLPESLDGFLRAGYVLHEGTIYTTSYRLTGYNEGDYGDSSFRFRKQKDSQLYRLELDPGSDNLATSEEQSLKLLEWFSGLRDFASNQKTLFEKPAVAPATVAK